MVQTITIPLNCLYALFILGVHARRSTNDTSLTIHKSSNFLMHKPSSAATGGLSLFTNEDMEKALGVAATKDLGQVESTQL